MKVMKQRKEILKMQKESLELIKDEIKKIIGTISPAMKKYYRDYKREFQNIECTPDQCSSKKELLDKTAECDLFFCGDYHTLQHSQHSFLTVAKDVFYRRGGVILGMEMVRIEHQKYLDSYLSGKIKEELFLKKIKYAENWGFNWNNYRPVFEFALQNKIRIVALSSGNSEDGNMLRDRDDRAAEKIAEELPRNLSVPFLVLFGDLHIAHNHIPGKTFTRLKKKGISPKTVIVFQNSETLFWKLEEKNINDEVDVVKIRENVFSIQSVAPWIKLQSYLSWMEEGEDFFCSFPEESLFSECSMEASIVFTDEVFIILKQLTDYLEIDDIDLTDFQVFTLGDMDFLYELDSDFAKSLPDIHKMLSCNKSFFFPGDNIIYLSRIDINYAAEEAGQYIHYQLSHFPETGLTGFDAFYRRVISESIGFFCSMLVNPKRKVSQLPDYEYYLTEENSLMNRKERRKRKKAVEYILKHDMLSADETDSRLIPLPLKKIGIEDVRYCFHISNELGHILGRRLYKMHLDDKFSKKEFISLLKKPLESKREAFELFVNLWRRTDSYRSTRPKSQKF